MLGREGEDPYNSTPSSSGPSNSWLSGVFVKRKPAVGEQGFPRSSRHGTSKF